MVKIAVYDVREDEKAKLKQLEAQLGVELHLTTEGFRPDTVEFAKGCSGASFLGQNDIGEEVLIKCKELGVMHLSTRTVGFNHVDVKLAKELGFRVSNAGYPPYGVAEFTLMLMLMVLRSYKPALWRQQVNDYSLAGLQGRELRNMTVGVIGTGKIGSAVVEMLHGFRCRILANSAVENDVVRQYAEYVDLETIYKECDIISIHVPLTEESRHMINHDTIAKMKDGVILINTARGELMDIHALTEGIESRKIGALAMDVFENEHAIYHQDLKNDIIKNREMAYLRQFPNVVLTQHIAFYTNANVESMVQCGIESLVAFANGETYACEL